MTDSEASGLTDVLTDVLANVRSWPNERSDPAQELVRVRTEKILNDFSRGAVSAHQGVSLRIERTISDVTKPKRREDCDCRACLKDPDRGHKASMLRG